MKKMFNKAVLNGTTVMGDGLTYPRIPNVYTGDNEGGYQRGDMMDANAVVEMIKELTDTGKITIDELQNLINEEIQERVKGDQDQQRYTDQKIKDLIGTSPETLDTLKEIADALGEDPDFAANVWNKIAELTTKHNEDVQELQDAITSGLENIDFTPYVKKTDVVTETTNGLMSADDKQTVDSLPEYIVGHTDPSGSGGIFKVSNDSDLILVVYKCTQIGGGPVSSSFSLNAATPSAAGVMSARDKKYMKNIPYYVMYDMTTVLDNPANIKILYYRSSLDGEHLIIYRDIFPASSSAAGAMSAPDKQKLDSLVNYQAGNGIDITGDTISCTLDTSLYSIVTELPETGLPNKIYLLPSTKTEEGNIYTEYGYVDNKWEEIGKYKADVDLSPYAKAMNLPKYIVGQDVDGGNIISPHYYPDKVKVKFVRVNLIDNSNLNDWFDISSVTTAYAGVMSCIDKRKLDGIEKSAQVNKIESVSVNGTPLEITNKGVNIPIHEYTAGDGIKLENGKLSLNLHLDINAADGTYWGGNMGCFFPIYDNGQLYRKISIRNIASYVEDRFDLGLLSTVDYKKFKAKQDALTEAQLNNINNAITSISINNIGQVNTNGAVNLTIPNATTSKEGLMSKEDKTKLDSQPTIKASDATGVTDDDYVVIKKSELNSILSRLSALENKA